MSNETRSNDAPVVEAEDTQPTVADSNEVQEIIIELLRRTTNMERRLGRLLDQINSVDALSDLESRTLTPTSESDDSTTNADQIH